MPSKEPLQRAREQDKTMSNDSRPGGRRRDLKWYDPLIVLLVVLLSFACLMAIADLAVRPSPLWQVPADMVSELDPDTRTDSWGVYVEPLRPEVMTPPAWDLDSILTPAGQAVVAPPVVWGSPPAETAAARPPSMASRPTATLAGSPAETSPTPPPIVNTPVPTSPALPTQVPTAIPPTPTLIPTPIPTPEPPPADTPKPEPTLPPRPLPPPPRPTPQPRP